MKNEEGVNYLWKLTVSFKVVFVWIAVVDRWHLNCSGGHQLLWRTLKSNKQTVGTMPYNKH